MLNIFLTCHVISVLLLIFFILLDKGKGSELGILNTGNDFFNAKTSSNFFSKIIITLFIFSIFTNLGITFFYKHSLTEKNKIVIVKEDK